MIETSKKPSAKSEATKDEAATKQGAPPYDPNKGCPICHEVPQNDFPLRQAGKPAAYPALVYHYAYLHPGYELPAAPGVPAATAKHEVLGFKVGEPLHAADDEVLAMPVEVGVAADGKTPVLLPYGEALRVFADQARKAPKR